MTRRGHSPRPQSVSTFGGPESAVQAHGLAARSLLALVRAYQRFASPLLGPHCRFAPSCSHYAAQALATHGALRGTALAGSRLLRCHPFHPGGHDPVPPARSTSATLMRMDASGRTAPATTAPLTARSRAGATS